jgi:hypothetical protein
MSAVEATGGAVVVGVVVPPPGEDPPPSPQPAKRLVKRNRQLRRLRTREDFGIGTDLGFFSRIAQKG